MMIWFAGILQNTCCNKINENKTKKPLSCVWCLLHNFAHSLTLCHMHQTECVLLQTHKWLIFFSGTSTSTIIIIQFFWTLPPFFFLSDWKHIFSFGRALKKSHQLFSCPWTTFLDAFLKKRMAPPSWKPEGIAKCRLEICNWVVRN